MKKARSKEDTIKIICVIAIVVIISAFALTCNDLLPAIGDGNSPANSYLSTYYIQKSMEETETPNIVTSVLADYRGFDTLFETCVMFLSGITALMVLWDKRTVDRHEKTRLKFSFDDSIMDFAFRIIIPVVAIYAFYVLAHGEISPGGGFQAGALLASCYLLDRIIHSFNNILGFVSAEVAAVIAGIGTFIYALTGFLPLFHGGNFLEYEKLPFRAEDVVALHSVGIFMIEVGVTLCVMGTIINILEVVLERTDFSE